MSIVNTPAEYKGIGTISHEPMILKKELHFHPITTKVLSVPYDMWDCNIMKEEMFVLFHLQELSSAYEETLTILYHWDKLETKREMYTCRPVPPIKSMRQCIESAKIRLQQRTIRIFIFVCENENIPYGKITACLRPRMANA